MPARLVPEQKASRTAKIIQPTTLAAIISGIEDALREYDLHIDEIPISPARILDLIWASKAFRKSASP